MTDTIEVVVRLTISEEDFDVNRLAKRVRAARDEAGRELFTRALEALAAHSGAVRQRRVARHFDTTLGPVVLARWRVKWEGRTTCLLDRLRGLARHSRVSPAVKKRASELASRRMTYRAARAVRRAEMGTPVSAQSVHSGVQPMGEAIAEREWIPMAASASPSAPLPRREVVVAEGDDPLVRSQAKGESHLAMKLGIGYRQKERQGPPRWKLADKVAYGGVEEPEVFAGRFDVRLEDRFQVERAQHVRGKGDGAAWICQGRRRFSPGMSANSIAGTCGTGWRSSRVHNRVFGNGCGPGCFKAEFRPWSDPCAS